MAAALSQLAGQANTLINSSFSAAAFGASNALYNIMKNNSIAQTKIANAQMSSKSTAANTAQLITSGSQGLAGLGVESMRDQLSASLTATESANQAQLQTNMNDVVNQGQQNLADQGLLSAQLQQAATYSSIGSSAGGVIGGIIGGIVGLAKGGQDPDKQTARNSEQLDVGFYKPEHITPNLNTGWVAGHVGNNMSVGTTNYANSVAESYNSSQDSLASEYNNHVITLGEGELTVHRSMDSHSPSDIPIDPLTSMAASDHIIEGSETRTAARATQPEAPFQQEEATLAYIPKSYPSQPLLDHNTIGKEMVDMSKSTTPDIGFSEIDTSVENSTSV